MWCQVILYLFVSVAIVAGLVGLSGAIYPSREERLENQACNKRR